MSHFKFYSAKYFERFLLVDRYGKETFENVIKYFIVDFDKDGLDLSGDEFIVPFVKYDGYIYFNSILTLKL